MQSGTSFAINPPRLSLGVAKNALTSGRTDTVKVFGANRSDVPPRDPSTRLSRARTFYSLIYTLSTLPILSVLLSSHFPPLLRAAPSPRRPSLSLRPLLLIRPIRPIRPFRVQKKKTSDSCANSPLKLSPVLYKPHAKPSAIPLKSRKTQIFSNFLSQSLARFRKSPYFCTR